MSDELPDCSKGLGGFHSFPARVDSQCIACGYTVLQLLAMVRGIRDFT